MKECHNHVSKIGSTIKCAIELSAPAHHHPNPCCKSHILAQGAIHSSRICSPVRASRSNKICVICCVCVYGRQCGISDAQLHNQQPCHICTEGTTRHWVTDLIWQNKLYIKAIPRLCRTLFARCRVLRYTTRISTLGNIWHTQRCDGQANPLLG